MIDVIAVVIGISAYALAVWMYHRASFPPDPKRWRSPGLSMRVKGGRIRYRKSP